MSEASLIFVIPNACSMAESLRYWTPKGGFTTLATAHFEDLRNAIEEANANVYVPLGEIAMQALTTKKGITKWRGSILSSIDFYKGRKVIPTIDPRTAIRQYLYRYFISADLRRVKEEANSPLIDIPQRSLLVQPSFLEAKTFLQTCLLERQVAVDIEVYKMEVSCISFAPSATLCMSIPFDSRWTISEEIELWLLVAEVLESETVEKIFQNGMFDISFLYKKNKINTRGYIHDTMVKHNLNYPDFPKGLGFITSLYTKEPYYKDEGKTWFNDLKSGTGSIDQFYIYNAKDSAVCFEANEPITKELQKFKNVETYEFNQKLFRPLLYMMARGILVDEAALAEHRKEARQTRDELQNKLNEKCGFALNVSSPMQCKKYFYDILNYAPQMKKTKDSKTGQRKESISTDDKAMKRLIRKYNSEEAKLVTQIRKYRKLIGTYLEVQYDDDKRLRCSFNMAGTATGRLSSSETIFGTGTNMQNLPKSFKKFLIADPGHVIVEVDKAQAEWVATAYVAGDARMIEACENDLDAHVHTANLMFGIPKELIFKEHEVLETSTDEDYILEQRLKHVPEILNYRNILPNMSCRQAGKKSNHSFNYGLSPQGFAIQYDMELKYAKQCYSLYHNAYPGLTLWHQHIRN
jgi:DNA polymerase I-like protein with 3'-5' exonuclease and polymerase domains